MRPRLTADQILTAAFAALACLIAVFLLTGYSPRSFTRDYAALPPVPAQTGDLYPSGSIDPNTAPAEAFLIIPGIGEKTAAAIVAERETNGAFYYPEDLLAVKGIGEKKLQVMRPYLCFPAPDGE